jgi:enoyl-CoA hydratase/carnithine racemase
MTDSPAEAVYEVDGPVATITLDRPDRLNAMTERMLTEYVAAVREAGADPAVRCVVVTGRGRGFCAGADLGVLADGPSALDRLTRADLLPTVANEIDTPVVMAVNGPCVGMGLSLAASGDIRLAGRSAALAAAFPRLGLTAEYGLGWLLPRLVGTGRAAEILLTGRTLDADEALRIGLVTAVHDDDALLTAAHDLARAIADGCSPWSVRTIKAQLRRAASEDWATSIDRSLTLMHESFARPELPEAIAARAEKRPPAFSD